MSIRMVHLFYMQVELNPAIRDVRGQTIFMRFRRISISILLLSINEILKDDMKGIRFCIHYSRSFVFLGSVIAGL